MLLKDLEFEGNDKKSHAERETGFTLITAAEKSIMWRNMFRIKCKRYKRKVIDNSKMRKKGKETRCETRMEIREWSWWEGGGGG